MQNAVRGALGIDEFFPEFYAGWHSRWQPNWDYVNVVDLNKAHIKAVEHILATDESDILT